MIISREQDHKSQIFFLIHYETHSRTLFMHQSVKENVCLTFQSSIYDRFLLKLGCVKIFLSLRLSRFPPPLLKFSSCFSIYNGQKQLSKQDCIMGYFNIFDLNISKTKIVQKIFLNSLMFIKQRRILEQHSMRHLSKLSLFNITRAELTPIQSIYLKRTKF